MADSLFGCEAECFLRVCDLLGSGPVVEGGVGLESGVCGPERGAPASSASGLIALIAGLFAVATVGLMRCRTRRRRM